MKANEARRLLRIREAAEYLGMNLGSILCDESLSDAGKVRMLKAYAGLDD